MNRTDTELTGTLNFQLNTALELIQNITQLDEERLSISDLLHNAIHLIPNAWSDATDISVAVHFEDIVHESADAEAITSPYTFTSKTSPKLQLRLSKKADSEFSKNEALLIDTVGELLSSKINRMLSKLNIKERQKLVDKAYQLAHIGTWEYDMINHELHWSDITKQVHGFEADHDPDVESTIQLFKEGYHRETFANVAYNAIEHAIPFDVELKIISGKGDERWIRATGEPEYKDGEFVRFYGISQNVTDRRQAEEDLELNERRFKALVQHGMDMIAILDNNANYIYASPTVLNVLNQTPDFFIEKNAFDLIHKDDKDRLYSLFISLPVGRTAKVKPFRFMSADKGWRWLEASITNLSNDPAIGGYVVNSRDITERQLKHEEVLDSLREKETLLAEIHHRIKNNLSVLTGLLQLQASGENNEEVLERLLDSVARIHTMASIHEQLYQTQNYSDLDFSDRIRLLATDIKKTLQTQAEVELIFRCEPVFLSVDHALACSLVINEVLTNIFKHAFSGRDKGKIICELTADPKPGEPHLIIRDDGVGLPEGFDPSTSKSLGLSLVDMLSDQIAEEYSYSAYGEGTVFSLVFNDKVLNNG